MNFPDFLHVVNPNSEKRNSVTRFFKLYPQLKSVFIERVSHPTHLETVVEWALNEGHHHIAVWGGDGTFSRVVQKCYESKAFEKVTLTLIPVGTCNDFARALQLPHWKEYAERGLVSGTSDFFVDVGMLGYATVDGVRRRIFMNNAGFGRSSIALKKSRSNPIGDILSFSVKSVDLDWILNSVHSFEVRDILLGVICNGPYFSKGLHFESRASVDDGVLNAYFEGPQSKMKLMSSFLKARIGFPMRSASTSHIPAQELSVQSQSALFVQADGEPVSFDALHRINFSVLPKALHMVNWV